MITKNTKSSCAFLDDPIHDQIQNIIDKELKMRRCSLSREEVEKLICYRDRLQETKNLDDNDIKTICMQSIFNQVVKIVFRI
jgi:hypothetical protein